VVIIIRVEDIANTDNVFGFLSRYKSIEAAAAAELQRQVDAANRISRWWWDVMMTQMSRAMIQALQQKITDIREEEKNEDKRFLQTMALRMEAELRDAQVWRAQVLAAKRESRQGPGGLVVRDAEEERQQAHNSVMYPKKYRAMLAAKVDERIDVMQRRYDFSVAPSDTFQQAIDRLDEKYNLGIGRKQRAKSMMMSKFAKLKAKGKAQGKEETADKGSALDDDASSTDNS
jgi:hypothetical protein